MTASCYTAHPQLSGRNGLYVLCIRTRELRKRVRNSSFMPGARPGRPISLVYSAMNMTRPCSAIPAGKKTVGVLGRHGDYRVSKPSHLSSSTQDGNGLEMLTTCSEPL